MFLTLLLSGLLTFVELNCENLFDYHHDEGKDDTEYLPEATRHWTKQRYWRKLNNIAQELLSCSDDGIPDLIALCEVENDSALIDLTKRSLLRNAGYEYLMTSSPDLRGIDVALLYSPFTFAPIRSYSIRVTPVEQMRPTRDILYACGQTVSGDTLHVFVVHFPSRFGGEKYSRPFRQAAADRLCQSIDSIQTVTSEPKILIAGDFNDGDESLIIQQIEHTVIKVSGKVSIISLAPLTYLIRCALLLSMLLSSCLKRKNAMAAIVPVVLTTVHGTNQATVITCRWSFVFVGDYAFLIFGSWRP